MGTGERLRRNQNNKSKQNLPLKINLMKKVMIKQITKSRIRK